MSYLDKVLQPGETLIHRAKLSWTLYIPGLLMLVLALLAYGFVLSFFPQQKIAALVARRAR